LAYNISQSILAEAIEQGKARIVSDDAIYNAIWNAKIIYLKNLEEKHEGKRKYKPVFNSKDAEIYNHIS
jgi:hypothetical protein